MNPPLTPRRRPRLVALLLPVLAALSLLAPGASAQAPLPGLDAPQAIGAFLGGNLPPTTPGVGTGGWEVVEAFPNLTFLDPVYLLPEPGSDRLFVVGKPGIVYSFPNEPAAVPADVTIVLDIRGQVRLGGDTGMLNMAFHPEYGQPSSPNRDYFYLYYRYTPDPGYVTGFATPAYMRLSRFTISPLSGTVDPSSELVLIQQFDRHDWHNGGAMFFGPEGFLYVTVGDEGGANDEYDSAQKLDGGLFSGVLRIDVDMDPARSHPIRRQPQNPANPPSGWPGSFTANYWVPDDNPWVDAGGNTLEEFYAVGLRSPHTMSRDPQTGLAYIGDVGQGFREEISLLARGANFQWPYREGSAGGPASQPGNLIGEDTPPLHDYGGSSGGCVIGGVVYRGSEHAATLGGEYLFGDHNSRNLWAMTCVPGQSPTVELLAQMPPTQRDKGQLASFGVDHASEVYMCKPDGTNQPGGRIYKLARAGTPSSEPPALLSQTGAFADLAALAPAPGVVPYGVITPLWSDGALKRRWLAVPNDGAHDSPAEQVVFSPTGNWSFPPGTVLIKHFEILLDERNPDGPRRRLETRFLVHGSDGEYLGATYRWRPDHSDADLVATGGSTEEIGIADAQGEPRTIDWLYPGRGACMICHTPQAGRVLGVRTRQLGGDYFYLATGRASNQLRTLAHLGIFANPPGEAALPALLTAAAVDDASASLQKRALSYIDSNCMQCHQPGGAALALFDARLSTPPASQGMIGGAAINNLGVPGAEIVKPQDLAGSVLYQRLTSLGGCCAMPPLAKNRIDEAAADLVANWILSLDPAAAPGGSSGGGAGVPGVAFEYYEESLSVLPDFDALVPILTGTASGFDIGLRLREENFAFRFRAKLVVETAGFYTFYTASDDGSRLKIAGQVVVDNDGLHPLEERSGTVANLAAGLHDIEVTFFDALYDNLLTVSWAGPGISRQPIPATNLFLGEGDLVEPVALLSTPSAAVSGPFPVTVTFSEAVTGLALDDFSVQNASASGLAGSGASYTLTLTPIASGEITIALPSDRVIDGAANANPPSNLLAVSFGGGPPADPPPGVTLATGESTVTGPFEVGVAFSEAVTGLAPGDFAIQNGSAASLTGSAAAWTLTVEPAAEGPVTVSLPAASAIDSGGNPNTASNLLAVTYAPVPPPPPPPPPPGGQEPFGGVAAPIPGRIEAENFDEGGPGVAYSDTSTENYGAVFFAFDYRPGEEVDIEPPSAAGLTPSVGYFEFDEWLEYTVAATPGTFEIRARVASDLADPGDLDVYLDGALLGTIPVTGTGGWFAWATVTLPGIEIAEGGNRVLRLRTDGATNVDWIEFALTGGGGPPVDPPPSVTLATAGDSVTGPFEVGVAFSEAVAGLVPGDFAIQNGAATGLSGSGAAWTLTVEPAAEGPVTVSLPAASAIDSGGNPNTASNLLAVTYAPVPPPPPPPPPPGGQEPFGGVAAPIPGRIEAENFDEGGPGVAYSDTSTENYGAVFFAFDYRPGEQVDIEPPSAAGLTPSIGYFDVGEWLEYSFTAAPGTYEIHLRVASELTDPGDLRILVDGVAIGRVPVTGTGGWFNWNSLTAPATVTITDSEPHVLRVVAVHSGINLDWIELAVASPTTRELFDEFLIAAGITGSQGAAGGDPDGDGATNLREFALGTNPAAGSGSDPLLVRPASAGGEPCLALTFPALAGGTFGADGSYTASGVSYRPVASPDLHAWELDLVPAATPPGLPALPAGYTYVTYMLPMGTHAGFICLEIQSDL